MHLISVSPEPPSYLKLRARARSRCRCRRYVCIAAFWAVCAAVGFAPWPELMP